VEPARQHPHYARFTGSPAWDGAFGRWVIGPVRRPAGRDHDLWLGCFRVGDHSARILRSRTVCIGCESMTLSVGLESLSLEGAQFAVAEKEGFQRIQSSDRS
jgi:hypothetical protein